ncbi:PCRF domain-containing protein, partial [Chloroflexota bacterium]
MMNQLEKIEKRYQEIEQQIAVPEIAFDSKQLQKLAQERANIESVVTKYREYKAAAKSLEEVKAMRIEGLDEEMSELVNQETENLEAQLESLLQELKLALLPKDEKEERDIITEIRAGAGGDEAGLFAADLFRMYSRYAQSKGWEVDIINVSEGGVGGFKEIIFEIKGRGAFRRLKYERGVHR